MVSSRAPFTTSTRVGSAMILSRIGNSAAQRPRARHWAFRSRSTSTGGRSGKAIRMLVSATLWVEVSGPRTPTSAAPKSETASIGKSRARKVTTSKARASSRQARSWSREGRAESVTEQPYRAALGARNRASGAALAELGVEIPFWDTLKGGRRDLNRD